MDKNEKELLVHICLQATTEYCEERAELKNRVQIQVIAVQAN